MSAGRPTRSVRRAQSIDWRGFFFEQAIERFDERALETLLGSGFDPNEPLSCGRIAYFKALRAPGAPRPFQAVFLAHCLNPSLRDEDGESLGSLGFAPLVARAPRSP